jgi:hypothetical protein
MLWQKLVISLGRRYVQYVNLTYRRTGTLWDSRYSPIMRRTSGEIEAVLGYVVDELELIHRTTWFCSEQAEAGSGFNGRA